MRRGWGVGEQPPLNKTEIRCLIIQIQGNVLSLHCLN